MKTTKSAIILLALLLSLFSINANAQTGYYIENTFLQAPATVYYDGLLGYSNPANLGFLKDNESRFYWTTEGTDAGSFNDWGLFSSLGPFGYGVIGLDIAEKTVYDHRLSMGFGSEAGTIGFGYRWSSGDENFFDRENAVSLGTVVRPFKFVSIGLLGSISTESDWNQGIVELGFRPLGTRRLTAFADIAFEKDVILDNVPWSIGAIYQPTDGIDLIGRYFENEAFSIGLTVNFGVFGFGGHGRFDNDQNHQGYTYYVRTGTLRPSVVPDKFRRDKNYLPMDMKGTVSYQSYVLFDSDNKRFLDILRDLKAARKDLRVGVVALNLSGMNITPENAWEIREELFRIRKEGKKVVIFFDRAAMTFYHLASVADKVVMDPHGAVILQGFINGRTFVAGTLDKLGLGFDEWRFFKYKSAAEKYSRTEMSEPDREQRMDYIDDRYEIMRGHVCGERGFTYEKFDYLIDSIGFFMADQAIEENLVDTLARWSDKTKIINNLFEQHYMPIGSDELMEYALHTGEWGANKKIAVIYALGECAVYSGIKARWMERTIKKLASDPRISAVVVRVDSPGGDGMASDMVAQALKECMKRKPVIISQGQVAASGGYWISTYSHQIFAGATTITGSIGVIGGWIWDKTFSDKTGMSFDFVKRGASADLGYGVTLPFIGISVPHRNLNDREYEIMKKAIHAHYDEFVELVSDGRDMPADSVYQIAEGRWYSGMTGEKIGLVDEIGGLVPAIAAAADMAGVAPDEGFDIVEVNPHEGLIRWPSLTPLETRLENDEMIQFIKFVSERNGQPLHLLTPGNYPEAVDE